MQDGINILLILTTAALGLLGLRTDASSKKIRAVIAVGILLSTILSTFLVHLSSIAEKRQFVLEKEWQRQLEAQIQSARMLFLVPKGFMTKQDLLDIINGLTIRVSYGQDEYVLLFRTDIQSADTENSDVVTAVLDSSMEDVINISSVTSFGQPLIAGERLAYDDLRCWHTTMNREPFYFRIDDGKNYHGVCSISVDFAWTLDRVSSIRDIRNIGKITAEIPNIKPNKGAICVGICRGEFAFLLGTSGDWINAAPHLVGYS